MKRHFRLRSSREINHLRQSGKAFSSPLVVLVMHQNQSMRTRIAVIATRSVGGAVERNRCKRVLRVAASDFFSSLELGYDLVLIGRKPLKNATFSEVHTAVGKVISDANIMKVYQNGG
jgi:ribonuclease P protein component